MEGKSEFERQLQELGYSPEAQPVGRTAFEYEVPGGRFAGRRIRLGFEVPPDFPRTPPGGPHLCPPLLPLNPNAPDHPARTAVSNFGEDWQYWSRPFPGWKPGSAVARYVAFVGYLLETA